MSFITAQNSFLKAETTFEKELMKEIERLAKLVIQTEEKAKSFCMAMGSASFHCEWKEYDGDGQDIDDFYECDENLDAYELADGNCYASDLSDLLSNWDRKFCLTGCPMTIKVDNVSGELITLSDW